jgi:hypothetical protein
VCQESSRSDNLQKDGAAAERDLATKLGFEFAIQNSLPKMKNPNPPPVSLIPFIYCKICFREMLQHLQSTAMELRCLILITDWLPI